MRRFVVLGLIACNGAPTEPLDTSPPSIPSDLPTDPQEDPSVAGVVAAHNIVRQGVGIGDLIWDDELAAFAANHVAYLNRERACDLVHSVNPPYGENLFWASVPVDADEVVGGWADEVADYDYASNSCNPGKACGHYTQIVWEDTERVGCAKLTCDFGNGQVWSCNYDPPGNWVGEWPY